MYETKKRHIFFYRLLRPLIILFLRITFRYRYTKAEHLPDNYIVISNHVGDHDPLFVAASFPRQMYFVGSEHITRWGFLFKLLNYAFYLIVRPKGASAATTVMEIMKRIRAGANVCLFAEGVRTWDGTTSEIPSATAKMVQKLGCGLVTYKIVGGYFASPMWSGASTRKGYIHGSPVGVYTKEEIAAMSIEEIRSLLERDLQEDAYARQLVDPKPYRGKRLAEKLENLLFVCPHCGAYDSFRSHDDTVTCSSCAASFRYTEYGMLEGTAFSTVKAFSDWQKEQVFSDVAENKPYTAPSAVLTAVKGQTETVIATGPVSMTRESLRCGTFSVSLSEISDFAMHGQRCLVFTANKTYYELIPEADCNALKFHLFFSAYKHSFEKVR